MIETAKFLAVPGSNIELTSLASKEQVGLSEHEGKQLKQVLAKRLRKLQELLYASRQKGLLVVFQGLDASGKNSTIRRSFQTLNPTNIRVKSFTAPTRREKQQDFLWRIHSHAPRKGMISIFNRSHYEDVVTARVRKLVDESLWSQRFKHVNAFEQMLAEEGTIIIKFYLHISKDYQKQRLQRRLNRKDKLWKFDPADIEDRQHWEDYMQAYNDAIQHCSTPWAPFYIVPSETRWYRDLIVMQTLVNALEKLDMSYPDVDFDPSKISLR
uniref:PPK2 family polyphosphate kinase n=1 Tax=Ningiella ruwaisensis TaxID=2364274 RepID=UPI00109EF537|nr:PPK2 family polyphosphate kinase [Ningiella ruwaisensis]